MNLIRTSFYSSISTAISFISGFIVIKVVAVKIGPSGIAFVGQYQNTIAILTMLATGAISAGVIKYLAEYSGDTEKQQKVITTALSIVLFCSFFIAIIIIAFSNFLSKAAFHTTDYWQVYLLFGIFITIISLNTLFTAVLNGLKEIRKLTIVNKSGSMAGILFTVFFAYTLGTKGVLIAGNFMALIVFIINLFFLNQIRRFHWKPNFKNPNRGMTIKLMAFTLMSIFSGFLIPSTQLLVRDKIIKDFSLQQAGYWQSVTKISDYYLGFIITVLSIYYLPRLSEISDKAELRKEILKGYKIILPAVGILAFAIWVCKGIILQVLFTPEFLPMLPLFKYQLIGDFFKIGSWLLSFLMLAKAMTKTFIITEILFSISFVVLSYILLDKFGIIGATYSFAINYLLYWITMWFLMKRYIR